MKKLVAMLLTFAMLLTLGVNVAFADCSNDTDKGSHPFRVSICAVLKQRPSAGSLKPATVLSKKMISVPMSCTIQAAVCPT